MKKYIILLFLVGSLFAQAKQKDWSDKTVNYPVSKDDSLSLMYADPGEKITSAQYNKVLRVLRLLQDKLGKGSNFPTTQGQFFTVTGTDSSTGWGSYADADSSQWRHDISDSIAGIGAQAVNYRCWTVVAKSGGKYSTIQTGINSFGTMKADSQAIVEIMPGEYNETITTKKYVNLYLHPGARLNYKTAGGTYTITADVTDTLWIMGGEIRRETLIKTSTGVISNAGKLFVTSDITEKGYAYFVVSNSGYFEYHGRKISSDRYYGSFISTAGTVYVDANYAAFCINIRGNTKAVMKWNKIVCRDSSASLNVDIRNTADVQIYSGITKQYYSKGGYNQEINYFNQYFVEDSSKLFFSGNWNFPIGVYDTAYVHVDHAWCDDGMPRLDFGGIPVGAVGRVTNCNIKWIVPPPIPRTTYGAHFSEAGGGNGRYKGYISNSYIQWSKYHSAAIDTAKEYGNIFYYSYGELYVDNCTLIDYGNDYGYGNMFPINSRVKHRLSNSHFEFWGSESGGADMFALFNHTGYTWDFEMVNCSVTRKGTTVGTVVFNFNNSTRKLTSSDRFILDNVSLYGNSTDTLTWFRSTAGSSAVQYFPAIWDSLYAKNYSRTFITKLVANELRLPGPGYNHFDTKYGTDAKVLMSGYASIDTVMEAGTNGDSAKVRIYYNESLFQTSPGNYSRENWTDADLGISIKSVYPPTGTIEAYYDVRVLSNDDGAATRYKFKADSVYTRAITLPSIVHKTASYTYYEFWIVNKHAARITIDIWIRPSLNVKKVRITRQ